MPLLGPYRALVGPQPRRDVRSAGVLCGSVPAGAATGLRDVQQSSGVLGEVCYGGSGFRCTSTGDGSRLHWPMPPQPSAGHVQPLSEGSPLHVLKEGEPRPQLTHPEDTLEPAPLPICTSWFQALPWRVTATGCLHIAAMQATRKHPQSHLAPSEHPHLLPPPSVTPATNSFGRSSGAHSSQTGPSLRRLPPSSPHSSSQPQRER